jgi:uncharacterized membrane protein
VLAACPASQGSTQMEDWLIDIIGYIVPIVEACGALVIVIEVARTIVRYLIACFRPDCDILSPLRISLGRAMIMGIEFQVAADILRTAMAPTWNDILLLAALIAIRTVLNYLLERELEVLDDDAEAP